MYIASDLRIWVNVNDEKKSRRMLDTAYGFDVLLVQLHPRYANHICAGLSLDSYSLFSPCTP